MRDRGWLYRRVPPLFVKYLNPKGVGIGIGMQHKKAAFNNGHLEHLNMFREWGMPVLTRDINLLSPDALECYYWFFSNVESSLGESLENATLRHIAMKSRNKDCIQFIFDALLRG